MGCNCPKDELMKKAIKIAFVYLIEAERCTYALLCESTINSDNCLSPFRCKTIIWTIAESLDFA